MTWQDGRQGGGYAKRLLFQSARFKFDCYLLRFEPECFVPHHIDPAPPGTIHMRWNMVLLGYGELRFTDPDGNHCDYFTMFPLWPNLMRASQTFHEYLNGKCRTYMLSIGWLRGVKAC